jgi:hypothetical protein
MTWKREDVEFAAKVEATAAKAALRLLSKIEAHAQDNFAAASWILERRFPELFSRPEVQLNLQTNVVQNNLSIVVAPEELREIEAQAAPSRDKVRRMFAAYRPGLGNGSGQSAAAVSPPDTGQKKSLPPIVRTASRHQKARRGSSGRSHSAPTKLAGAPQPRAWPGTRPEPPI